MGKRSDFGEDWAAVIARWGLGTPLPVAPDDGWDALGALERLYPARLDRILADGRQGVGMLAPLIDLGHILAVCEPLCGVAPVLTRLTAQDNEGTGGNDRRAAAAELRFAALLVRLGYPPRLEPTLGTRAPDGVIATDAGDVYYEVIAPTIPQVQREALREIQGPLDKLLRTGRKRQEKNGDINAIRADLDRLMQPTSVYFEVPNKRGATLLDAESKHFPKDTMNLVAMDVSAALPFGFEPWLPFIANRFQPRLNRRLGAVVLIQTYNQAPTITRRCAVVANLHAYKPLPLSLVDGLRGVDHSTALETG
jgi:hypothetical protein